MKQETEERSNRLLWISLAIFALEYLGIIGYYWIFGGHMGDSSLTISRFVGLNPLSSIIFCVCNVAIAVMLVYYTLTNARMRGFVWRFLMMAFLVTFIALSISPHVPDESAGAQIHIFFAGAMFVAMALIGIYTIVVTQERPTSILSVLFIIYGLFFIICDIFKFDFFMSGVLWYESAYLFAFFAVLINSNRLEA